MKSITNIQKNILMAMVTILFATASVSANNNTAKTVDLNTWQKTYDDLRDLTPKWGMQSAEGIKTSLSVGVPMVLLDVRTSKEWKKGVIKDAELISLNDLAKSQSILKLPKDKKSIIVVYCKGSVRSTLAMALLQQLGYQNATMIVGGITAWREAKYPVIKD